MGSVFWAYFLGTMVNYFAMHIYFSAFSCKSIRLEWKKIAIIIALFLVDVVFYYYREYTAGLITSAMAVVIETCIGYLHEKRIVRCMILSGIMIVLQAVCETCCLSVTAIIFKDVIYISANKSYRYVVTMVLYQLVFLTVATLIYIFLKERNAYIRHTKFWCIVVAMAVGSVYIIYYISMKTKNYTDTGYFTYLLCIMAVLAMNIIVFIFYDQISNSQMVKEERDNLLHYIELQETEQQNVDSYNRNISKIRHDIKNYMIGISSLINQGKYDIALDEINKVSSEVVKKYDTVSTCDSVLNHILNAKLWIMNEKNMRLERKLYITEELTMSAGELSVLLGNVLDNAIEYVGNHKGVEQLIRMDMSFDRGILIIGVQNRVEDEIIIPKDMIIKTTKADKGHGLGMKSIKEICDRYNGKFDVKCESGNFIVNMMMILPGDNK